jgi:Na+-transporting NADH:ubiquinone oxidoreductase subunit A
LLEGRYDVRRKVAVCGPAAVGPAYVQALPGTDLSQMREFCGPSADGLRIVSGDVLTGRESGWLGFYDTQVTILKEGTQKELLGWMRPVRLGQFSADRTYFGWLFGKGRRYDMDTNLHGGRRAFVMSDSYYAKVLPMDIYPLYLIKACLASDLEKMERFGIYEVLPEDFALCEYIDPSKNDIQEIIAKGIDLMLKETA